MSTKKVHWWHKMTPEEQEAHRAMRRARYNNLSDEEKERRVQKRLDTINKMSTAKRKRWAKKIGKNTKKHWAEKTPEQMEEIQKRKSASYKKALKKMSKEKRENQNNFGKIWKNRVDVVVKDVKRVNDYSGVISMSELASL